MATNVFELFGKLSLDSNDFEQGLVRAKGMASSFGGMLSSAAQVGIKAIGAATTAAVGFAGASVKVGADFDKSMSQVAATMGKTTDEIVELRDFAQEMGRTTMFSATQAADALNYMALAGYDATTSMNMLPNVLNLAAAGSMDLARASDMVTDTQTAFGISLERTSQLVDEMAKAASTGNTSVEQLGDAFLVVGGLAQELNGGLVTLEDGTTQTVDGVQELEIALTAMANAGIKGSEAGTHMRNMLMKLSGPSSDGAKALEAMGVKVFDTTGKMRSLKDVFGDLNEAMSTMTQEQKIQTISDLFNARDLSSAEAMLNAVSQDWDKIGASIVDAQGAASAMAETQMDNLAGDITYFKSALEGAQIAISDELTPALRDFVQLGTQGLSDLTSAFKEGGLEGAMASFGETLSKGLAMVMEGLPSAVDAGISLLSAIGQGIMDNIDIIVFAAWDTIELLFDKMLEATKGKDNIIVEILSWIVGAFVENSMTIIDTGYQIITNLLNGAAEALPDLLDDIEYWIESIVERFTNPQSLTGLITAGANFIKSLIKGIVKQLPDLIKEVPIIIGNLLTTLKESTPEVVNTIVEIVTSIVEELPNIITALTEALPQLLEMIVDTLVTLLPVILDGIVQIVIAIADNLPTIIQALVDAIPVIIQAIINGWMTALPAVIQAFVQYFIAIASHMPEIIKALIDAIPMILEAIVEGFRPLIEKFSNLFNEIGTAIATWWTGKKQDIANGWAEFIANVKQWFDQLPYNLGYALADMIIKLGEWYTEAKDWVATNVSKFIESIVNWFAGLPNKIWNWLLEVINKIGKWITDTNDKVQAEIPAIIDNIAHFFEELPGKAWNWGVDMINSFVDGIASMAQQAWDAVEGFVQGIADRIGHSHPKTGPLAKDYEWMPDMMKLFAEGIEQNADLVNDAVESTFDFSDAVISPEVDYQRIYQSDTAGALNQMVNLLQQLVDSGLGVEIAPEADGIFRIVEKENRRRTRATGYNTLAQAGG